MYKFNLQTDGENLHMYTVYIMYMYQIKNLRKKILEL